MSNQLTPVYGIDLGTTYSCIAYVDEHGKPLIIPNSESERTTPSVVFFDEKDVIVGTTAKQNSKLYPAEVVSFIKRSMGDPYFEYAKGGTVYKAEEISSFILRKLVKDAEQSLDLKIKDVVITCPAYFGVNEREATRMAGQIAGLNVRHVLNEPTAAAFAFGMAGQSLSKTVLVYDLGGGTFDITMISLRPDAIEVICTGGDQQLGGKDWDEAIIRYLVDQFCDQTGTSADDLWNDPETCQELQLTAESVKKELTQRVKAPARITHGGERASVELTREKFEELTAALLERTIVLTQDMLNEAKKKGFATYDEILLVGGSTRMLAVAPRIQQEFGLEPKMFDPDEAVAKGAALFGFKLSINDDLVRRISAATGQSREEIEKGGLEQIAPAIVQSAEQGVARDHGFTLAAVKRSGIKIKNVCSKSFGIVVTDSSDGREKVFNLILKNTTVPAEFTERFGTQLPDQREVELRIMENEVNDQKLEIPAAMEIGKAVLEVPPGLPAGSPIEITFILNEEGCLEMTATEMTQRRVINATVDTKCVIAGEELEEAMERGRSLMVS